jgi:hypothetical protein
VTVDGRSQALEALLLPGVPVERVEDALLAAGGDEIGSGKLASPGSSAALAVNGFGWFLERPADLPPFPGLEDLDWPAERVEVERTMRFSWSGGRHPWLDAAVETPRHLIGVESKRFEPFRDTKCAELSPAYDRDVWGDGMARWTAMRDRLRAEPRAYRYLDAAQLVKRALGLHTEADRRGRAPVLLYLYSEPRLPRPVSAEAVEAHRVEIAEFAEKVDGAVVRFQAATWRDWLGRFVNRAGAHGAEMLARFGP